MAKIKYWAKIQDIDELIGELKLILKKCGEMFDEDKILCKGEVFDKNKICGEG